VSHAAGLQKQHRGGGGVGTAGVGGQAQGLTDLGSGYLAGATALEALFD
jgi:hypothetical protein